MLGSQVTIAGNRMQSPTPSHCSAMKFTAARKIVVKLANIVVKVRGDTSGQRNASMKISVIGLPMMTGWMLQKLM